MLVIRVAVSVKPEEKANFVNFMQQSVVTSQQFDGCLRFDVYENITDPNGFILYEEWQTQENFDGYKASDHFKQSMEVLSPMMSVAPDSAYYTANLIPA